MSQRFYRREKVQAYRSTFMTKDGTIIEGQQFEKVEPIVDYSPPAWFDAETGEKVRDQNLILELEALYKAKKA